MKKLFVIIALMAFSANNNAQISKGMMMVAGSFNSASGSQKSSGFDSTYHSSNASNNNYSNLGGSLRYGYFVTDHIMIGLFGGYSQSISNYDQDQTDDNSTYHQKNHNTTNTLSGGLFARYYKMLGKSRFAFFGQLNAGYGIGKNTGKVSQITNNTPIITNSTGNSSQVNAFINVGLVYFINKHIAVEASFGNVGYNWQKTTTLGGGSNNNESVNAGFNSNLSFNLSSLSLGVNFYFGGKPTPKETTN